MYMSYTRQYRLDLVDTATGARLASYPETQRRHAQREAVRLSLDLSGGRNMYRVAVVAVPVMVRPNLEECAA
ncbi:MAG: hypothetical protein V1790_17685 [Planctomycetota bacterium]